ncbi:MAG: CHASE2 domain-containing protein [Cyanobium sp.]
MTRSPSRSSGGSGWGASAPVLWPLALALPLLLALPPLAGTLPAVPLQALDSLMASLAFRLRGPRPVAAAVVVLAIDSDSLTLDDLLHPRERRATPLLPDMGPWPWSRALQADLAAWVLERGARQVVFNLVHSQPSRFGPADDQAFVRRLAPWRQQLVLAVAYSRIDQDGVEQSRLRRPRQNLPWAGGLPRLGLTTLLQGPMGMTEAIPGQQWSQDNLQGFALPHPPPLAFAAAGLMPPQAPLAIDFPGPAAMIPRVPAWRVPQQSAAFWRGRTVVIGVTSPELGDQQETPFGPLSGTEIEAAAIATVLSGRGRLPLPPALSVLLLLGWGGGAWWLLRRRPSSRGVIGCSLILAALALLLSGAGWALARRHLPASALLLGPLLAGGVRAAGLSWREHRERAYLHQLLARCISPSLLQDILRQPGPIWTQVGGSRCRCVVLFTDLVGFIPLSASLEAGPLFSLLNRYFEVIASAVIEEQGLVDKFIGDALMAEFGVPRSRGEVVEARAAARAALRMQRRLEVLNRALQDQGLAPLRHGIGLHVGEVIAGNLGSSERLEFTVVGATVNLACRLESLTRTFPQHPILISAELRALLPSHWPVQDLGPQWVKGWPEPIAVFALGDPGDALDAMDTPQA